MLGFREEIVGGKTRVVAEERVHARLHVEAAAFDGIVGTDGAEPTQRYGKQGGKSLVEVLTIVVEKRVRVDEVRREDLADRVLKAIAEQILAEVGLRNPDVELAPGGRGQRHRAGRETAEQRRQLRPDRPPIFDDQLEPQRIRLVAFEQLVPVLSANLLPTASSSPMRLCE